MKVFISHASEDKETFVRSLAETLQHRRLEVWYDEFSLKPGDSLRESIEKGIATANYGIVIISEAFFAKRWPQQELNGLFGRDLSASRRFLIPIWHNISAERVQELAPMLADRVALRSSLGVEKITRHILAVLIGDEAPKRWQGGRVSRHSYAHRYYKRPEEIPKLGYELRPGGFSEMVSQLRPREIIIAYFSPNGTYDVATHVTDEERMLGLEKDSPIEPSYFAVDVRKVIGGFDQELPESELRALLGYAPEKLEGQ